MKPLPWPAERWPTPEEWLAWLLDNDPEDQTEIAARVINSAQKAHHCDLHHAGATGSTYAEETR